MTSWKIVIVSMLMLALTGVAAAAEKAIFSAKVVANDGTVYMLNEVQYNTYYNYEIDGSLSFLKGESNIYIPLNKIKKVDYTNQIHPSRKDYRLCTVTLTDGSDRTIYAFSAKPWENRNSIYGKDVDFGEKLYVPIANIRTIDFMHDGTYAKCNLCGSLFYNSNLKICPYDKQPLTRK